jgi:hypothetical protein
MKGLLFLKGSFQIDYCFEKQTDYTEVDWNGRCETPAGAAGQVRPRMSVAKRRLTARPAESEHPAVEINHPIIQEQRKEPFKN